MGERRRGLVSYRISLVVAVPLFVVVTGALVTTNSYLSGRANVERLGDGLFGEAADRTADAARAHLREAAPAVDALAELLSSDPAVTLRPTDELARRLLAVLRANRGFAWVSFSDVDGTFTGVRRSHEGSLIVSQTRLENDKSVRDERTVGSDGTWTFLRHDPDARYDPRTRPWYVKAVRAKKRTWTDPYVFFDEGVPGMTCAAPVYDALGALRGVVTADFTLNSLGDFVADLHPSPHATVFVYADSGALLAHPTVRVVEKVGSRNEGTLVTKEEVTDPVTRKYFRAPTARSFDVDGKRWFSATRTFEEEGLKWSVAAVAPEADFMTGVEETARQTVLLSIAIVLLAVGVAALMASWLAAPLGRIARDMQRVGRFELDDATPPYTVFREVAVIHEALSLMKRGLMNFAVYVPRDLVRAVLKSGQRAELGGRTKHLTVFFSDLAGFTTLSETMSPDELVKLLGVYFDEMTSVIAAHGGTIDKFIGDAIMAFWNAPEDAPDHAVRACEAALACQRKLMELKEANEALRGVSARIGIATGDVLVGNIGSRARMNYTVMGDTVNLASRLEGLGKVYGVPILVTAACRDAAKADIAMRPIDVVAVKGRKAGVMVYEPLGPETDGRSLRVAAISERAMEAYLSRRFDEARETWDELLAILPGDVAATKLRDRAAAYAQKPPDAGWSGAQVMTEK